MFCLFPKNGQPYFGNIRYLIKVSVRRGFTVYLFTFFDKIGCDGKASAGVLNIIQIDFINGTQRFQFNIH